MNLNEVQPAKHKILKDGAVIIETNMIDMAMAKWDAADDNAKWQWFRNGELIESTQEDK